MELPQIEQFAKLQDDVDFYKEILNAIPALIYINAFTSKGAPMSLVNEWSNRFAQKFIGYSNEEIREMGFSFFLQVIHPDDLEIIKATIDAPPPKEMVYTFLHRLRPKGEDEYKWMFGKGISLEEYDDGFPKRTLNIVIEISDQMHTENQLITALKEINKLKHELFSQSLTKREKEVLVEIARASTDKEIGAKLNISSATAKTHRNKIIKKLGMKNTASIVAFAIECGWR